MNDLPEDVQQKIVRDASMLGWATIASLRISSKVWRSLCKDQFILITSIKVPVNNVEDAISFMNQLPHLQSVEIMGRNLLPCTLTSNALDVLGATLQTLSLTYGCHLAEDGTEEISTNEANLWAVRNSMVLHPMTVENVGNLLNPWRFSLTSLHINNCHLPIIRRKSLGGSGFFSRFPQLRELRLISLHNSPHFTTLNLCGCTALRLLNCNGSHINSLDITACTALQSLFCHRNNLVLLDVSTCTSIVALDCQLNELSILDTSACADIKLIQCSHNRLDEVIFPPIADSVKFCYVRSLRGLVVMTNPECLTSLECTYEMFKCIPREMRMQLVSLDLRHGPSEDVSGFLLLQLLSCQLDVCGIIDVSQCDAVELHCDCWSWNFNVAGCEKVIKLLLKKACIYKSDLAGFTALRELHVVLQRQACLDLWSCRNLRQLTLTIAEGHASHLRKMCLQGCIALEELVCNKFSTLDTVDLTSCLYLKLISFFGSGLKSLDLSRCLLLSSLDVSESALLRKVCVAAPLTDFKHIGCTDLKLECNQNPDQEIPPALPFFNVDNSPPPRRIVASLLQSANSANGVLFAFVMVILIWTLVGLHEGLLF